MKTRGRIVTGIATGVLVLAVGAGVLWKLGKLPGVAPAQAATAADSTAVAAGDGDAGQADDAKSKKGKKDKPEVKPVPVELAAVTDRGIAAYYRAASVIEADRLVDLVSRGQGRVRSLQAEEGDWVEKGAVLAELENDREQIQLRKAELTVADKLRQLDRSRSMLAEELISRQEFDDVESAWRMAEAERDLAAIALEDTRIRAPFAGRVTERRIVAGQQLAAATPAFTLGDFSPLRVRVHLPEEVARKVEAGQRVLVAPEAMGSDLEASVERISPVVDPATSTVRLTLLLDDDAAAVRVGGFVKVRITTDEHHDALAIPKLALVEEGALRSVFVAEADTVRKAEIETGLYDETHVEVLQGLFAGDFVVTMGQGGLRTGTPIKALNAGDVGYVSPTVEASESDPAVDAANTSELAKAE